MIKKRFFLGILFIAGLLSATIGQPSTPSPVDFKTQADSLHSLGSSLVKTGKYDSAQVVFQSEVKLREELSNSIGLAKSLNSLAESFWRGGKTKQGLDAAEKALKIIGAAVGEEDTLAADSYTNIGHIYCALGDNKKALENFNKALAIRIKTLGPEHLNVAMTYNNIGVVYYSLGDGKKSLDNYNKALTILLKTLGPEHPYVGSSYSNIGSVYSDLGDQEKALENLNKALTIQLKTLGPEHPDVAGSFFNIGIVYYALGNFEKALENYKKALAIRLKTLSPEHPDVAGSYNNIGEVYKALGDFEKALENLNNALIIKLKTLGPDHPDLARSYSTIGAVYCDFGYFDKALENHNKALAILLKALGPEHPMVAWSYNNIGTVYQELGDYEKALENWNKALTVNIKTFGPEHPYVAAIYHNIGNVYQELGDYEKALENYNKALAIRLKTLGPEHPEVAGSYHNIGNVYFDLGDKEKALEKYNKALTIRLKTLGPEHPDVAMSLNNIGGVYDELCDYEKALENHNKALAILLKVLGPEHPDVASNYNGIGAVYNDLGDYEKALENHNKALTIEFKTLGPDHPDVLASYQNIAATFFKKGDYDSGLVYAEKGMEVFDKIERAAFYTLSEKGAVGLGAQYQIYTLTARLYLKLGRPEKAYEMLVQNRERALSALIQRNVLALKSAEGRELWDKRSKLLAQCAALFNQIQQTEDSVKLKNLKTIFAAARDSLEATEQELTKKSRLYGEIFAAPKITVNDVINHLPPNSSLIEYAFLEDGLYSFVVRNEERGVRVEKLLGKEELAGFKKKLAAYRTGLTRTGDEMMVPAVNQGVTTGLKERMNQMLAGNYKETDSLSRDLYATLLAKIVSRESSGVKRLFIIPDGILNFLPFEALVGSDGRFLIERCEVSYLNTARELIKRGEERVAGSDGRGEVLAYGAPNYDADSLVLKSGIERITAQPAMVAMRSAPQRSLRGGCMRGIKWDYLEGTKDEVTAIQGILGGSARFGNEATEALFKREVSSEKRGMRYIHLATHGYFSDCPTTGKDVKFTDPMSNSGIVFAGANSGGDGYDDGFLTALEVLGLDLSGVELVTLSTCESGLGELKGSEGVFGLKRSFIAAGAQSLLVSLWGASDYWTKELMVKFYKKLKEGIPKSQALRDAKLEIMEALKTTSGSPHPFFWAPFIMIGAWR